MILRCLRLALAGLLFFGFMLVAQERPVQAAPGWSPSTLQQDRMPPIPENKQTEAQKKVSAEFLARRKTPIFGPFVPLLRSPELALRANAMGEYIRYGDSLPQRLNEFIILITARDYTQEYEWYAHYPPAIKAGLNPEIAKAVAEGRRPAKMPEEEEIVYDFCMELNRNKSVSDATYARAIAKFGDQGVMDMVGVTGWYGFIARVLNVARTPVPKDYTPVLVPLPR
jgi:4-carboxymuconolactone decarboxylase